MSILSKGLGLVRKIMFHCQFSVHLVLCRVSVISLLLWLCVCVCLCVFVRERQTDIQCRLTEIYDISLISVYAIEFLDPVMLGLC